MVVEQPLSEEAVDCATPSSVKETCAPTVCEARTMPAEEPGIAVREGDVDDLLAADTMGVSAAEPVAVVATEAPAAMVDESVVEAERGAQIWR